MTEHAKMFQYTQLRPVIGIDIFKIRKKHIPLYEKGHTTKLLQSVQEDGLPKGVQHALNHISSAAFKGRLNDFELLLEINNSNKSSDFGLLVLALQEIVIFSQGFSTLEGKEIEEVREEAKSIKKRLDFDVLSVNLDDLNKDSITDDCYSLILLSPYYPEYRRFVEMQYRLLYLSENHGGAESLLVLLFSKKTSFSSENKNVLRKLFKGKILLPQGVKTNDKPLPSFQSDTGTDTDEKYPLEAVKGMSLSAIKSATGSIKYKKERPMIKEEKKAKKPSRKKSVIKEKKSNPKAKRKINPSSLKKKESK